jgi:hypothetical protein
MRNINSAFAAAFRYVLKLSCNGECKQTSGVYPLQRLAVQYLCLQEIMYLFMNWQKLFNGM